MMGGAQTAALGRPDWVGTPPSSSSSLTWDDARRVRGSVGIGLPRWLRRGRASGLPSNSAWGPVCCVEPSFCNGRVGHG